MEPDFEGLLREIHWLLSRYPEQGSPAINYDTAQINKGIDRSSRDAMSHSTMNAARCFIVDFSGSAPVDVTLEDVTLVAETMGRAGPLMHAVETFLAQADCNLTDRGCGVSGWHLGVFCTPGEAWRLVKDASTIFNPAIKAGLLHVEIKPGFVRAIDNCFYTG